MMRTVAKRLIDVRSSAVVPPDKPGQALAERLVNADTVPTCPAVTP
ncbi:MAG TPA: hypothetical protein VF003_06950 [Pseudonocardiaceae bacterium]